MTDKAKDRTTAVWQRGPVAGYAAELQPVVHALLDVMEEIEIEASTLSHAQLWARPGGVASVGFHLVHLPGSTDRLFTYALDAQLSDAQRDYLRAEGVPLDESVSASALVARTNAALAESLALLHKVDPGSYQQVRYVGRARIESTTWGLLFHAAEHASRHAGQLTTTARIVRASGVNAI